MFYRICEILHLECLTLLCAALGKLEAVVTMIRSHCHCFFCFGDVSCWFLFLKEAVL